MTTTWLLHRIVVIHGKLFGMFSRERSQISTNPLPSKRPIMCTVPFSYARRFYSSIGNLSGAKFNGISTLPVLVLSRSALKDYYAL